MKVVSALVVVFALLIALGPSPGAAKVQCPKQDNCATTSGMISGDESKVECDECATWVCVRSGVAYSGDGCNGDSNVCGKPDECYFTHHDGISKGAAALGFGACTLKYKPDVTATGECTPNKDGTKTGVLTIGGMLLLSWIFGRF